MASFPIEFRHTMRIPWWRNDLALHCAVSAEVPQRDTSSRELLAHSINLIDEHALPFVHGRVQSCNAKHRHQLGMVWVDEQVYFGAILCHGSEHAAQPVHTC